MKHWVRNAVFLIFWLAATGLVIGSLVKIRPLTDTKAFKESQFTDSELRQVVDRVDEAFASAWKTNGVEPVGGATDLAIARRLSLALTGTIPSLEEIRAIESHSGEQRVQWWLSHLLEDRRYSDYLAERFARVVVGVEDGPFIVYRRHRLVSWLSDQFAHNRPYDELVRDLIASEGIWTTKPEVNFITVTIDQNNKEEGPDEQKLAARVSRAFLGLRIDCVQCHNDFLGGKWKQENFHQLAAFFNRAEMSMTGVRDNAAKEYEYRYLGKPEKQLVTPKVPFNEALLPEEGPLRTRLAAWVTHPDNRPFARAIVNRISALLFNRPLHAPVDQISLDGPFPPGMEILADDLIAHKFDIQRLIRILVATRVFQLDSRTADPGHPTTSAQEAQFASFPLTRLRPEQVGGSILQSAKLKTIDANSHVFVRIMRFFQQNDFLKRYGDMGEDEFAAGGGTIPQRLVMMNGNLVHERTKQDLVMNSATRIGAVAPDDRTAIETAYLTTLTRRPSTEEQIYFVARFKSDPKVKRSELMEDLFWTLLNSTEFSWNH